MISGTDHGFYSALPHLGDADLGKAVFFDTNTIGDAHSFSLGSMTSRETMWSTFCSFSFLALGDNSYNLEVISWPSPFIVQFGAVTI